jgi:hypothetical protein
MNRDTPQAPVAVAQEPVVAWMSKTGHGTYWRESITPELAALRHGGNPVWRALVYATPGGAKEGWQPIATAPKDGTEILAWREDCGMLVVKWTCWDEFATDRERDEIDEDSLFKQDWFFADFRGGGRLEGSEVPTLWQPEPPEPQPAPEGEPK